MWYFFREWNGCITDASDGDIVFSDMVFWFLGEYSYSLEFGSVSRTAVITIHAVKDGNGVKYGCILLNDVPYREPIRERGMEFRACSQYWNNGYAIFLWPWGI